ncbi:MAG: lysylphosphatidylglycerol synthase transmembrane domain-containing protein [Dermatophilaceae bacterium]
MTTTSSTWRQVLRFVLGVGLAGAMLGWGLPYFTGATWSEIWAEIRTVPLDRAVGFQVLMLLGLYAYTLTLVGSLRGLTHDRALVLNLCGSSISKLFPGGGALGLAATFFICRSWGFTRRAVSTSAIVTAVWNVLARIALPVAAIAVLWVGGTDLPDSLKELAVGGSVTGAAILVVFVAVIASERAAEGVGATLDRILGPLFRRGERTRAMSIRGLVHDLRARITELVRRAWWSMTLGMVLFLGAYYLLFVLVMRQVGVDLSLDLIFAAYAIGRLLTAVGVTPGGLGVTETATAAVLVGWGADPTGATAGVVLFSIFTNLMELPLGGLGWLAWTVMPRRDPPPEGEEEHALA